jgi:hypothetical protein
VARDGRTIEEVRGDARQQGARLDKLESRLEKVEGRLDSIDTKLDRLIAAAGARDAAK